MALFTSDVAHSSLQKPMKRLYESGLQQKEPYWQFGYPYLTGAFPALRSGVWYLCACPNVGKSALQLNIGYNLLAGNDDVYWMDFTLDDSIEDRLSYLLACAGEIPINLVKQAGNASEEEKQQRFNAFKNFRNHYGARYYIDGITLEDEETADEESGPSFTAEWIARTVAQARKEIGPEKKLFVTVDSFHDMGLEKRYEDENDRLKKVSRILKYSAGRQRCLYLVSAHTVKGSYRRGQTMDVLKGTGETVFDGKIITHLYADVFVKQNDAAVFWLKDGDSQNLMPVHELDILKNKAGSYRGILFYNFYPAGCKEWEADEITQGLYRSSIFSK